MKISEKVRQVASIIVGSILLLAGFGTIANAATNNGVVVFLTRIGSAISTYPRNNAFLVGTTTPTQGGTPKLGVFLNASEGYPKAFEIASTTGIGTATTSTDIFLVKNTGCIQLAPTSSATLINLKFIATTTLGTGGALVVAAAFGACP